jgi:hypothetical protein
MPQCHAITLPINALLIYSGPTILGNSVRSESIWVLFVEAEVLGLDLGSAGFGVGSISEI